MLLTFRDFTFRARHALPGRSEAAAHSHWHTYTVRFWFRGQPDQDELSAKIGDQFHELHNADLTKFMKESTDEALATFFLHAIQSTKKCVKVTLTNDGQRGAEATP